MVWSNAASPVLSIAIDEAEEAEDITELAPMLPIAPKRPIAHPTQVRIQRTVRNTGLFEVSFVCSISVVFFVCAGNYHIWFFNIAKKSEYLSTFD
jgi:hypothetical protein